MAEAGLSAAQWVWVVGGVAGLTAVLAGGVRRYALQRGLMDVPNDRSSHHRPTPRGGGVAIAVAFFIAVAYLAGRGSTPSAVAAALLGGGLLVAAIGWADDHSHIPARWRATVHGLAAVWAVWCLGGYSALNIGVAVIPLGAWGSVLAVLGIVWLTNLYNFMDGIDGLAGGQAVVAGLGGAVLLWWVGAPGLAVVAAGLAAASTGFLVWNWSPARLFMGDVGSGLLGYSFAVLALAGDNLGALPVPIWGMLLAIFILDATFTLVHRVVKGEPWYAPHRSHAYQRLTQMGWSHARVSVAVMLIVLLVLFPSAALAVFWPWLMFPLVLVLAAVGWWAWRKIQKQYAAESVGKVDS
ncbi:MAG TPA: glycosyltransferase family 4 protein [Gammaproteobacteria bacterium]|nr:glycosyltransferase family 4 protein [Gammaproteobacteria bacterium]